MRGGESLCTSELESSGWTFPPARYHTGSGCYLPAAHVGFFFMQGKKGEAGPPGTPGSLGPQVTTISVRPSLAALLP